MASVHSALQLFGETANHRLCFLADTVGQPFHLVRQPRCGLDELLTAACDLCHLQARRIQVR